MSLAVCVGANRFAQIAFLEDLSSSEVLRVVMLIVNVVGTYVHRVVYLVEPKVSALFVFVAVVLMKIV